MAKSQQHGQRDDGYRKQIKWRKTEHGQHAQ